MNEQKRKHGVTVIILLLVTAAVIAAVLYLYKAHILPQPVGETAGSTLAASTDETVGSSVSDETAQSSEPDTEWLPSIEYDAYTPSEIEQQNFRQTVILGNSQAQALSNFGLIRNADFVTKVGLSILHVLSSPDGNAPIQKLNGKTYQKAVFVFGENELGWPYPANFIKTYKQVIARVREMNPGVEVYIQGIFPVTAEVSEKNTNGVTNENVRIFNDALETMCSEIDATFMPVSDAFRDETGALPQGAAFDGVHFGYDLCKIWAGDLSAYIGEETETAEETTTEAAALAETEPTEYTEQTDGEDE